jgi:hypothetical protein
VRRALLLVALLFVCSLSARAQTSHTANRFQLAPSAPATCGPGDVYFNTTTGIPAYCQPANTWLNFGSSTGGSPGGSPGQMQYQVNGTTFGGAANLTYASGLTTAIQSGATFGSTQATNSWAFGVPTFRAASVINSGTAVGGIFIGSDNTVSPGGVAAANGIIAAAECSVNTTTAGACLAGDFYLYTTAKANSDFIARFSSVNLGSGTLLGITAVYIPPPSMAAGGNVQYWKGLLVSDSHGTATAAGHFDEALEVDTTPSTASDTNIWGIFQVGGARNEFDGPVDYKQTTTGNEVNPPSGYCRTYYDSTSGKMISITSTGSSCAPAAVTSLTGDGTFATNSASTGAVTLTLATAGAHKWWGNNTGSTAAPGYEALTSGDIPTGIPIANVGSAGLSGTAPVTISAAGAIACSTCTTTIASGTAALTTSGISSGTCSSATTVSAASVATTDSIIFSPNTDATGVTGYAPSASGSLYIWGYPTSGNVNFKVCNNTGSTVTPSALTVNWRVTR